VCRSGGRVHREQKKTAERHRPKQRGQCDDRP
jgi:hypothetical protein